MTRTPHDIERQHSKRDPRRAHRASHLPSARGNRAIVDGEKHPRFLCNWLRTVFIHYAVDVDTLAPLVPFELDTLGGEAYVSLVAFTSDDLRPRIGGSFTRWASAPVAKHGYLNVRTYVRHEDESAIYFLAEWLPNRLSQFIGSRTFGLPLRYGSLDFRHEHERGNIKGRVIAHDASGSLRYQATISRDATYEPCEAESLDEFLLERYTCFTQRDSVRRRFRVWHEPWPQMPIDLAVSDERLLDLTGDWRSHARFIGAHYSPGVHDVWIGGPHCINGRFCS